MIDQKLGHIFIIGVLILLLALIILSVNIFICVIKLMPKVDTNRTLVRVDLYGHTADGNAIYIDNDGTQYVVPWLNYFSPDDIVMLEFNESHEITRAWVAWEAPYALGY